MNRKHSPRYHANVDIDVISVVRLLMEAGVQRASMLELDALVRLTAVRGAVTAADIHDCVKPCRFDSGGQMQG